MAQHLSADDHAESFRGSPLYMVSTHNWDTGNCVLHVFVCSVNIYCGHTPSIMQERIWVGGGGGGFPLGGGNDGFLRRVWQEGGRV